MRRVTETNKGRADQHVLGEPLSSTVAETLLAVNLRFFSSKGTIDEGKGLHLG